MLDSAGALQFAGWTETEARRRVVALLRCGWRADHLAAMFGCDLASIDRLSGACDQPTAERPAAMTEEVAL
jgi:hypothetical protein